MPTHVYTADDAVQTLIGLPTSALVYEGDLALFPEISWRSCMWGTCNWPLAGRGSSPSPGAIVGDCPNLLHCLLRWYDMNYKAVVCASPNHRSLLCFTAQLKQKSSSKMSKRMIWVWHLQLVILCNIFLQSLQWQDMTMAMSPWGSVP